MDFFSLLALAGVAMVLVNSAEQRRRIGLLAQHLGPFRIEKLMEQLTTATMRGLGERDAERRQQIWSMLASDERALADQFARFAASFRRADEAQTRVSRWPVALPFATRIAPSASFDARALFDLHARAIDDAVSNKADRTPKDKAFVLMAEMLLMQHSCHWFCKSRTVASARLLARHKTSYPLALESVAPATRSAYRKITGV